MVVTLNPSPQYAHETKHVLSLAAVAQDIRELMPTYSTKRVFMKPFSEPPFFDLVIHQDDQEKTSDIYSTYDIMNFIIRNE